MFFAESGHTNESIYKYALTQQSTHLCTNVWPISVSSEAEYGFIDCILTKMTLFFILYTCKRSEDWCPRNINTPSSWTKLSAYVLIVRHTLRSRKKTIWGYYPTSKLGLIILENSTVLTHWYITDGSHF